MDSDSAKTIPVDPDLVYGKLENGLTYYIKQNGKPENRVELLLVVNTGSIMEEDHQQGLAHFAEHMAFNGTKRFPKQELVNYLESIGMQFGPDLNAYTSFDETVYMLQIPTDDEEKLVKGFEILEDWAHQLQFENEEIDKERGVVIEEWRMRSGARQRLLDQKLPMFLKGSKYANRMPIGKKDILETFEYDAVKSFYKDWYRPDLMSVVAVGDMSEYKMDELIKKYFNPIKKIDDGRKRVEEDMPSYDEYRVAITSDPELPMPRLGITYFYDPNEDKDKKTTYKKNLIGKFVKEMFSMRLSELTKSEDPPFMYAGAWVANGFIRTKDMMVVYAASPEDKMIEGFSTLVREIERVIKHGFIDQELDRVKSKIKSDLNKRLNEKDKTESRHYKFAYKDHYLKNKPYIAIDDEVTLFDEYVDSISRDDVNESAFKSFTSANKVLDIDLPEKESVIKPTEDDVISIYNSVLNEEISPYTEEVLADEIFNKEVIEGSIISENYIDEIDIKELILSNGMKVIIKQTDFKNDEILFDSFSFGGHSIVSDDKFISANEASDIISRSGLGPFNQIQLEKFLSDKNVSVSPYIKEISEGIKGKSTIADQEFMFKMIHLYFTEPKKDSVAFNSYIKRVNGFIENRDLDPQTVFFDSVRSLVTSNHYRTKPLDVNRLEKVNLDDVHNIYTDRFSDPDDFTFVFVGNIEEESFKKNINKYLASIPTSDRAENFKDVNKIFPDGINNYEVSKGLDPKSFVYVTFNGEDEWSEENSYKLDAFTNSFRIKVREVLREDMGGTYGVWMPSYINHYPKENYYFRIIFGCDPDKVDVLTEALFAQIDSVKNFGLSEDYLNKTKEIHRNDFDKKIKENKYWLDQISGIYTDNSNYYKLVDYKDYIDATTNDEMKILANKYLNTERYVKVVLYPEN